MAESSGAGSDGEGTEEWDRKRKLSVVVITHDEEARIDDCLDSIFDVCADLDRFEVVLVDSRSMDRTVEIAREYSITVLQLPPEPTPTPSAGRYVGTAATSGDLVLFVDGDMVLQEGWLEDARRRVRDDPSLAGVDGHLDDSTIDEDRPTDVLRGVTLYDRSALADVSGFDPFLNSLEDIDLSYRLAASGYRLVRLADVAADHQTVEGEDGHARRWANGYYHGRGELFRTYLSQPKAFARLLYRTRLYGAILAWIVVGIATTIVGSRGAAVAWTTGTVAGVFGSINRKGPDWTIDKLTGCWFVYAGIALGLPGRNPAPDEYPIQRVETIRTADQPADTVGQRVR